MPDVDLQCWKLLVESSSLKERKMSFSFSFELIFLYFFVIYCPCCWQRPVKTSLNSWHGNLCILFTSFSYWAKGQRPKVSPRTFCHDCGSVWTQLHSFVHQNYSIQCNFIYIVSMMTQGVCRKARACSSSTCLSLTAARKNSPLRGKKPWAGPGS